MTLDEKPGDIIETSASGPSSPGTARNSAQLEASDLEKALSRNEDQDVAMTFRPTTDPNVINWDGPDDPENPLNWTARRKWTNIAVIAGITVLT